MNGYLLMKLEFGANRLSWAKITSPTDSDQKEEKSTNFNEQSCGEYEWAIKCHHVSNSNYRYPHRYFRIFKKKKCENVSFSIAIINFWTCSVTPLLRGLLFSFTLTVCVNVRVSVSWYNFENIFSTVCCRCAPVGLCRENSLHSSPIKYTSFSISTKNTFCNYH